MRKMTKFFSLLATLLFVAGSAFAEDAKAPVVAFSGLVDSYFSYNLANTDNGALYGFSTKNRSYTLGLAELGAKVTAGEATANIVLMYGEAADAMNLGSSGQADLMAANLSFTKMDWTFTFGKFMTWMGNEVVESKANMNYSRSVLFFGIPLYHTGLSVSVNPDAQFGATAYVVNGWNNQSSNNIFKDEKSYGLQVKFSPKDTNLGLVLNGIYGPDPTGIQDLSTGVGELIVSYAATDKLSLALDAQMGMQTAGEATYGSGLDSGSYLGAALYGRLAFDGGWAVALRLEEVIDNGSIGLITSGLMGFGGVAGGPSVEVREATLTIENAVTPNVLARLEGRADMAYSDGNWIPYNTPSGDSQYTVTASTVFSF